jgi:hypothetical protein
VLARSSLPCERRETHAHELIGSTQARLARVLHELTQARALPLHGRVRFYVIGNAVAIHDQALECKAQIRIGNTPLTEQVKSVWRKQLLRDAKQPFRILSRRLRQRRQGLRAKE